jgi:BlaI family transcriptional regulator, penicillinase repressor
MPSMGKKRTNSRFASGDLELLEMLWRAGPVTILEAQQALALPIGYTTVQTRLNRLVKKGAAKRTATRPAKYSAAVTPEEVGRNDLDTLVHRVSAGRVTPLVAHLLNSRDLSAEELRELKELVSEAERKSRSNASRKGSP